jgi:formamidopyrimidine-DNA glycosylase
MPEGPECTIVARQLHSVINGKTISNIEILTGRYLKKEPDGFTEYLDYAINEKPQKVLGVNNKGKFIYWITSSGVIFSTLGMTGTYKTEDNKYARVRWDFDDGFSVYYSDMRNFGTLKFFSGDKCQTHLNKKLSEIGPDMLNEPCDKETWLSICKKKKNNSLVKFLMEQKNLSGVGNIYKSESLFLSALSPHRTVGSCSEEELLRLYKSVKTVLKNSLESGGATIRNYSDLYNNQGDYVAFPSKADDMMKARIGVMVYSQKEDPYGNPVERIVLDDKRTTHWSPTIQK